MHDQTTSTGTVTPSPSLVEQVVELRSARPSINSADSAPWQREEMSPSSAQRRRRHLAVYHRALRAASTPAERAAVSARYRRVLNGDITLVTPSAVTLAS